MLISLSSIACAGPIRPSQMLQLQIRRNRPNVLPSASSFRSVQIQRRHFRNSKIRDLSFLVFLLYASPFQLPWWGCAPHFVATNWIGGWWYLIKLTQIPLGVAWKPLCPPEWATIDDVWSENAKTYGISHSVWPCLVEPLEPLLLT